MTVGEYYGRHTPYGQVPRTYAMFLQENGKVAQYSIPDEPQQNGVAERRNRTMNGYGAQYDKLLHLTVEPVNGGVKTAIHILNRVSRKSVPKTPYELWTERVLSLNHLRVCGGALLRLKYLTQTLES